MTRITVAERFLVRIIPPLRGGDARRPQFLLIERINEPKIIERRLDVKWKIRLDSPDRRW
jgi:hypothetical protein